MSSYKICPDCNRLRDVKNFYISKKRPDGLHHKCKPCVTRAHKLRMKDDPTYIKNRKIWADNYKNKDKKRFLDLHRWRVIRLKYGISKDDYYNILGSQGGGCAVCKSKAQVGSNKDVYLDVDHDHVTGRVRGLLCRRCNTSIGKFEDSTELLVCAAKYLDKTRVKKYGIIKTERFYHE